MIDIRFPLGLMFSIFGVILTIYGLATIGHACHVCNFAGRKCQPDIRHLYTDIWPGDALFL